MSSEMGHNRKHCPGNLLSNSQLFPQVEQKPRHGVAALITCYTTKSTSPTSQKENVWFTSSNTSRTAAPHGSSSGSIPPPGTIHCSGCRLLLTSSTCKQKEALHESCGAFVPSDAGKQSHEDAWKWARRDPWPLRFGPQRQAADDWFQPLLFILCCCRRDPESTTALVAWNIQPWHGVHGLLCGIDEI